LETAPTVQSSENGHSDFDPEYYFDVSRGTLLLSKFELDFYLATGAEESDIYELGELIRNAEIEINRDVIIPEKNWAQESRQSYIDYGHWLIKIAALPDNLTDSNQSQKNKINETMIQRAYKLGLGPSRDHIMFESRFGSLTQFYIELGENKTSRRYVFKDWSEQDCLDYLSQVTNEIGHFPKLSDLNELAVNDINRPTAESIKLILGYSIVEAANKIGQMHPRSWKIRPNIELLNWGLDYMRANNGVVPTVSIMRKLSKQKLDDRYAPPSPTTTRRRFKKFSNYQKLLKIAYSQLEVQDNYHSEVTPDFNKGSGQNLVDIYKKPNESYYSEADIRFNALTIGADYAHATGGEMLTENNLSFLFSYGLLDYPPDKIFEVFDNINDYQVAVLQSYQKDLEEKRITELHLQNEIELINGNIPPEFLLKYERHKYIDQDSLNKKNNGRKRKTIGVLTNEIVDDEERFIRYAKLLLANRLIPNGDTSMVRRISIAVGLNLETGYILPTYSAEIRKSNTSLSIADVECAALEMGLYDYIYPSIRKRHLNHVLKAANNIKIRKRSSKLATQT